MRAFHNDPKIKDTYLKRIRDHALADELVKGQYWEDGKGCAVGCTIHSSDHGAYETELGIPRILARIEDGIFEALPNDLAKAWPERFLNSIKPGADLSNVWNIFATWMLIDPQWGVIQFAKNDRTRKAIQDVGDLYSLTSQGKTLTREEWKAVRAAAAYAAAACAAADAAYADAYAAYAADAAYDAAAAYAAYDAAYDAAAAAAYAADAAYDARIKWRIAQADKLIELLEAAT